MCVCISVGLRFSQNWSLLCAGQSFGVAVVLAELEGLSSIIPLVSVLGLGLSGLFRLLAFNMAAGVQ